jgi:gamma-glutamylcyclotransferase (GGCT)/AIG2-like uncharacterized protein YtfP
MLVFVYGTLKRGYGNNRLIDGPFVGYAHTNPEFELLHLGGFPGMVEGSSVIGGEVYNVKNIAPLDRLEGHPHFYERRQIQVFVWDDKQSLFAPKTAWAYIFQHDNGSSAIVEESFRDSFGTTLKVWERN